MPLWYQRLQLLANVDASTVAGRSGLYVVSGGSRTVVAAPG